MTLEQRLTANALQAEGFTISSGPTGVVAVRGNDHRLIHQDGSQHRAKGAKK